MVWWAFPERLLGLFAGVLGRREAWDSGHWTEADETAALQLARRTRGVLAAGVFFAAFLAGAVAAWARLGGSS